MFLYWFYIHNCQDSVSSPCFKHFLSWQTSPSSFCKGVLSGSAVFLSSRMYNRLWGSLCVSPLSSHCRWWGWAWGVQIGRHWTSWHEQLVGHFSRSGGSWRPQLWAHRKPALHRCVICRCWVPWAAAPGMQWPAQLSESIHRTAGWKLSLCHRWKWPQRAHRCC